MKQRLHNYLFKRVSIVMLTFLVVSCKKDAAPSWRNDAVYSEELTGGSSRKWKLNYMITYPFKNDDWQPMRYQEDFGPGNTMEFYADGRVVLGDSMRRRTFLPDTTTWVKMGNKEPFGGLIISDQTWKFDRYYPSSQDHAEGISLLISYDRVNSDSVIYSFYFELDKQ